MDSVITKGNMIKWNVEQIEATEDRISGRCSTCIHNCGADIVEEEPCKTCLDFDNMGREKPLWTNL